MRAWLVGPERECAEVEFTCNSRHRIWRQEALEVRRKTEQLISLFSLSLSLSRGGFVFNLSSIVSPRDFYTTFHTSLSPLQTATMSLANGTQSPAPALPDVVSQQQHWIANNKQTSSPPRPPLTRSTRPSLLPTPTARRPSRPATLFSPLCSRTRLARRTSGTLILRTRGLLARGLGRSLLVRLPLKKIKIGRIVY